MSKPSHWADNYAEKIIREKGDKELYVCASGITPSGTVHIGNFREIITVELVVRALRDRGKKVRFIYSWDDYDVFRKVPSNMPNQKMLAGYLRQPITLTPDPYETEDSYARRNEREIEELLPIVGIKPRPSATAREAMQRAYAEPWNIASGSGRSSASTGRNPCPRTGGRSPFSAPPATGTPPRSQNGTGETALPMPAPPAEKRSGWI